MRAVAGAHGGGEDEHHLELRHRQVDVDPVARLGRPEHAEHLGLKLDDPGHQVAPPSLVAHSLRPLQNVWGSCLHPKSSVKVLSTIRASHSESGGSSTAIHMPTEPPGC